ncbi:MAG: hypothetical protein ACXWLM_01745 [Myxococcales bacterium]
MLPLLLAAALTCPDDQIIGLDLPSWRKELLADVPGSDEQHREMAALRMSMVPTGSESEAECIHQPTVEGVDVFDANLTGQHDKLVQVRFRMCKGTKDEWQSLRIALLLPLPEKRFCLFAGDDPSVDQPARDKPCTGAGKLPRTLAFKVLDGHRVIEAQDQSGSCDPEVSLLTMTLYEAQGVSLVKIFDSPLLDAHATASGAMLVQRWKVTLGRTIHVERCTEGVPECDSQDLVREKASAKYVGK